MEKLSKNSKFESLQDSKFEAFKTYEIENLREVKGGAESTRGGMIWKQKYCADAQSIDKDGNTTTWYFYCD